MSDLAGTGLLKTSALAQRKTEYEAILRSIGTEHVLRKGELLRTDHICYLLEGLCILSFYGPCGDETTLIYFEPVEAQDAPTTSATCLKACAS